MTNQPITYYWAGNTTAGVTTPDPTVYLRWVQKLIASGEPFTCGIATDPHQCVAALNNWLDAQEEQANGQS
jgi:hypothetical protein